MTTGDEPVAVPDNHIPSRLAQNDVDAPVPVDHGLLNDPIVVMRKLAANANIIRVYGKRWLRKSARRRPGAERADARLIRMARASYPPPFRLYGR